MDTTTKFCPHCGRQLRIDAQFCGGCGGTIPAAGAAPGGGYAPPAARTGGSRRGGNALGKLSTINISSIFGINSAPQRENEASWSRVLSIVLAVLLLLTAVISIVRGTLYNAVANLNVERMYDELLDEFDEDNYLHYLANNIGYSFGRISQYDVLDFLNDRQVKRGVQKVINGYLDTLLTGNADHLLTERDVRDLVRSVEPQIEDLTGNRLSTGEINNVTNSVMWYVSDFMEEIIGIYMHGEGSRTIERFIRDLWDEAPAEMRMVRVLLSPTTKTILIVIDILLLAGLLWLNRRHLWKLLSLIGVPVVVKGAVSLVMLALTNLWVNIIADMFRDILDDMPIDSIRVIVRPMMNGYSGTALTLTLWCLILGVGVLILNKKVVEPMTLRSSRMR